MKLTSIAVFCSSGRIALAYPAATDYQAKLNQLVSDLTKGVDSGVDYNTANYYVGYRGDDYNTRWAKYFNTSAIPVSSEFTQGLQNSPYPASAAVRIQDAGTALAQPGYLAMENGFAFLDDGGMTLAVRTDQPAPFTGEQFDFWFGWYLNDTTKYKLWHPGNHQYAAVTHGSLAGITPQTPYRQRYWDQTSFVDEFIGAQANQLSIGFFNPRLMAIPLDAPATGIETTVAAFVALFQYREEAPSVMARAGPSPFDVVLVHQVRAKPGASGLKEIRSRFWFGSGVVAALKITGNLEQLVRDLATHCAQEMGHLGTFLPALFQEFKGDVATSA